jgi:hypothetical protein
MNGISFDNIRAQDCGAEYNATTDPYGFDITDNPRGGHGVYLDLRAGSSASNVVSERNYATGICLEPNPNNSGGIINGLYLEGNATDAVSDGKLDDNYQSFFLNTSNTVNKTEIFNMYSLPSTYKALLHNDNGSSDFIFHSLVGWEFSSNDDDHSPITLRECSAAEINRTANNGFTASNLMVTANGMARDGTGSGPHRDGVINSLVGKRKLDFASATPILLATIRLRALAAGQSSSGTLLINAIVEGYNAGDSTCHSQALFVNFATMGKVTSGDTTSTVTQVSTVTSQSGPSEQVTTLAITTVDSFDDSSKEGTVEVYGESTVSGDAETQEMNISGTLMGGGMAGGAVPSIIFE